MAKKTTLQTALPEVHRAAFDLGNANSKIAADGNVSITFRSIQAVLSNANRFNEVPIESGLVYDGLPLVIGKEALTHAPDGIQQYPTTNRYRSSWYHRLFAYALLCAFGKSIGKEVITPKIITSIPAALYQNKSEAEAVKAGLCGNYAIGRLDGATLYATIEPGRLMLIPEGLGTYFGYVVGAKVDPQKAAGNWLIADAGYLTLDTVMLNAGRYMPDSARSDDRLGTSVIVDKVRQHIFSQARVTLSHTEIDGLLEADTAIVNKKPVEIAEVRDRSRAELGARASIFLEEASAGRNLAGIILTGGGAEKLLPYIENDNLPAPELAQNPVRANVEGAYNYLTLLQ